jgi:hypothetical protein
LSAPQPAPAALLVAATTAVTAAQASATCTSGSPGVAPSWLGAARPLQRGAVSMPAGCWLVLLGQGAWARGRATLGGAAGTLGQGWPGALTAGASAVCSAEGAACLHASSLCWASALPSSTLSTCCCCCCCCC